MNVVIVMLVWNLFVVKPLPVYKVYPSSIVNTFQSGTISNSWSNFAVDGDISTCSIAGDEFSVVKVAWWRVELDGIYNITKITITNTPKTTYFEFLNYLRVYVALNEEVYDDHLCASISVNLRANTGFLSLFCSEDVSGKYVTIKRSGGFRPDLLVLCEVSIHFVTDSISPVYKQPTFQSGVLFLETSKFAVDNNNDTCTKVLAGRDEMAWWRVSLNDIFDIDSITIFYKQDSSNSLSLNHFSVYVSNDEEDYHQKLCVSFNSLKNASGSIHLKCREVVSGSFVTISKFGGFKPKSLFLCEVILYGAGRTIKTCTNDEHRCEILSKCLKRNQICDNKVHCPDGTDELNCNCSQFQYKCVEGRCITKDWLCDGIKDCPNGDDEEISSCASCKKGEFKCLKDNRCIIKEKRCDGFRDCPDLSDEHGCLNFSELYIKIKFLKATFKGTSDYYFCSTNWNEKHGLLACKEMGFGLYRTLKFMAFNASKFLRLKNEVEDGQKLPFMMLFEKSLKCQSKLFVRLSCQKLSQEVCGVRGIPDDDFGPYIFNGERAKPGAWPWYVQIFIGFTHFCGGSLIRNDWILTAAHCLRNVDNASNIYVKMGTNVRNDPMVKRHRVSKFILHPNYSNFNYDAAIVKLENPIFFTNKIRTICLPNMNLTQAKLRSFRYCVTTGLGLVYESYYPKHLMQGRMNIMAQEQCLENLRNVTQNVEWLLKKFLNTTTKCAGSFPTNIGVNTCWGDSGGPLVCKNEHDVWTQVGIVKAFMYTRERLICTNTFFTWLDYILPFIQSHVQ